MDDTINIEISYKINVGRARPIWLIKSGGVKNAAIKKTKTIAYFLPFFSCWEVTKPTLANKESNTGSWKQRPKAIIKDVTKFRYSLTFGNKVIENPSLSLIICIDIKNLRARGIII